MEIIKGMDLTKLSKAELIAIIYKLIDEVEVLRMRVTDLEEKVAAKGDTSTGKKQEQEAVVAVKDHGQGTISRIGNLLKLQ